MMNKASQSKVKKNLKHDIIQKRARPLRILSSFKKCKKSTSTLKAGAISREKLRKRQVEGTTDHTRALFNRNIEQKNNQINRIIPESKNMNMLNERVNK